MTENTSSSISESAPENTADQPQEHRPGWWGRRGKGAKAGIIVGVLAVIGAIAAKAQAGRAGGEGSLADTNTSTESATTGGSAVSAAGGPNEAAVFVAETGTKYHREGCDYLDSSKIPISLEEAKAQGYEPCSVCHPPG